MQARHESGKPLVSVLIVSYNTRELTLSCIASVIASANGVPLEVIVVDNASADGSAPAIASQFPEVCLIASPENLGFARANNIGVPKTRGEYLLLLNPDTVLHESALRAVLAFARSKPRAAIVGCRTLNGDGSLQRNCFLPPSLTNILITSVGLHRVFPRSRLFGRERMTYWELESARQVPVVAGCFMLLRAEAVAQLGLFDDQFFMYAEEVDLCVRYRAAGWEIWYTPSGTITHYGGVSAATAPGQMRLEMQRSLIVFLNKHHSKAYVRACRVVLIVGLWVRAGVLSLKALLRLQPRAACHHVKDSLGLSLVHVRGGRR